MSELLDEVLRAIRDQDTEAAAKVRNECLVDGHLLVTPAQYNAVFHAAAGYEAGRLLHEPDPPRPGPFDIPVVVVKPGPPQHLWAGKWAVVGPDGRIYVLTLPNPATVGDAGTRGAVPLLDTALMRESVRMHNYGSTDAAEHG